MISIRPQRGRSSDPRRSALDLNAQSHTAGRVRRISGPCWHPSGVRSVFRRGTGGVASLDPRLIARTPAGVLSYEAEIALRSEMGTLASTFEAVKPRLPSGTYMQARCRSNHAT